VLSRAAGCGGKVEGWFRVLEDSFKGINL